MIAAETHQPTAVKNSPFPRPIYRLYFLYKNTLKTVQNFEAPSHASILTVSELT